MDTITFRVKGSGSVPYEVSVIRKDGRLLAQCDCQAGSYGRLCKHRIGVLDGNPKAIVSSNVQDLDVLKEWLKGSELEVAVRKYHDADWAFHLAEKELKAQKSRLQRVMNQGE